MDTLSRDMQRVLNFPDEMEKMLQPPARAYVKNAKAFFRTPADVYEHPGFYSFLLDMPGLEVEKIKVKVENGILHVAGKKPKKAWAAVPPGVKVVRVERKRARYARKFTLPGDANPEEVKATYKDGVLTVIVNKKVVKQEEQVSEPKSVPIPVN